MTFWKTIAGKFIYNVAILSDETLNTISMGAADETVSSRIGKIKRAHGGIIPWNHPIAKIIDAGLEEIHPGHSIHAIDDDDGQDAVIPDPPKPKEG